MPISYAQVCEVGKIKQVLRKILYLYFTEPGSISLSKEEVKDLLVFYLSISAQNLTADCSVLGTNSNKPIFDVMTTGENLPERIPSCADGTKYGECSKFRPAYCYAGVLYQKCDLCGCPLNSVCGKAHKCEPLVQNITCFKDIDCGQNAFVGDYSCTNSYISRNYINYTCVNPGTTSSKCVAANSTFFLTYCNPNLNQICVSGQSTCQTTINDSAPTVAISVTPTTVAQGQFFNVTVTGTDDVGLAMMWWWGVNTIDAELNKAHLFGCNGAKFCSNSWLVSTNATGTITLGANSRDTAYPVVGQPHQASEGAGIAYATITVTTVTGAVQNLTGFPDLVVINLGTYTGTTSTNILISAIILNNGTGPAQNTCDGLYVETLNARGFCGGPTLMPGQTKSISSAFALPVPGTFKVRADTDYGRWVNESNEYNNVVWSTITVTSPYSAEYSKANTDLTVTDINVQLPTFSSSADVKVTTKNLGSLATGQYWVLTKVTHIDTGKITNVQRLAPVVQPGGAYTTSHGAVGITEYGTYKVEAFVDNSNYIPEFDENNNYLTENIVYGNQTNATVQCVDYDNGDNILVASYAKKGTEAQYDKCGTTGQSYDIIEGVCTNDQLSGIPHSCPTGTKCKDIRYEPAVYANVSACVNETVTNQTTLSPTGVCMVRDSYTSVPSFNASDVGIGYAKKAILGVNDLNGLKTACTNNTFYNVMQSYCTQNSNPMQQQLVTYSSTGSVQSSTCGVNGCTFRNCTQTNTSLCSDSDNGLNYYIQGIAKKGSANSTDYCGAQNLNGTQYVLEQYCDASNNIQQVPYLCPGLCSTGACVPATVNCTDSDGGLNFNVKGVTSKGTLSYTDYCGIGSNLFENYCANNSIVTNYLYVCPNGCSNGACINTTASCVDSDGGLNYNVKGNATKGSLFYADYCGAQQTNGSQYLLEQYCDANANAVQYAYLCPGGCNNGVCINITTPCVDSDNGLNFNVKGTVTKGSLSYTDYCGAQQTNGSQYLLEQYCDVNANAVQYTYLCPNGCNNSACISQTTPTNVTLQGSDGTWCYDPDGYGSVDIYNKKYCQDSNATHDDYCETSSLLRDWYCTGTWNGTSWRNVKCAAGGYGCACSNGACI